MVFFDKIFASLLHSDFGINWIVQEKKILPILLDRNEEFNKMLKNNGG